MNNINEIFAYLYNFQNLSTSDSKIDRKKLLMLGEELTKKIHKIEKKGDWFYNQLNLQQTNIPNTQTNNEHIKKNSNLIIFNNYDYLGLSNHEEVKYAAKQAIDIYGTSASASPYVGGYLQIHLELEKVIKKFLDLKQKGVSLYSSGYQTNLAIASFFAEHNFNIVVDQFCHKSISLPASLSENYYQFLHNDMEHLESLLFDLLQKNNRPTLVCTEGIFSVDGDFGKLKDIVRLAKQYNAMTLVDEAHSIGVCGPDGRGVAADQGVLSEIDFFVITFSKALGSLGGAIVCNESIKNAFELISSPRIFSCGLAPASTAAALTSLNLIQTQEGSKLIEKLKSNINYMNSLCSNYLDKENSSSWILPFLIPNEANITQVVKMFDVNNLKISPIIWPAVPKGMGRLRAFICAHHNFEDLELLADTVLKADNMYGITSI